MKKTFSSVVLWDGLPDGAAAEIYKKTFTVNYQKGTTVTTEDNFKKALGIVVSGSVSVTVAGGHGFKNRIEAGGIFGCAALFGGEDTYVSVIEADRSTEIAYLPEDALKHFMERYPVLAYNYIKFLSDKIRFLNKKINSLGFGTEQRLYNYLKLQGTKELGNKAGLARRLNLGRTSLYRAVESLERDGLLIKQNGNYILKE